MTNTATAAARWVAEIEKHVLTCQQIMIEAAAKCGPYKTLISEAKAAAKEEGVGTKALNALILERKHLRNAAKVREKLDDEDLIAELEMLRDQVPVVEGVEDLFSFAKSEIEGEIAKVKRGKASGKSKSDAIDSLTDDMDDGDFDPRPPHLKDVHKQIEQEAAERNAEALQGGIKTLN